MNVSAYMHIKLVLIAGDFPLHVSIINRVENRPTHTVQMLNISAVITCKDLCFQSCGVCIAECVLTQASGHPDSTV